MLQLSLWGLGSFLRDSPVSGFPDYQSTYLEGSLLDREVRTQEAMWEADGEAPGSKSRIS